MTAPYQEDVDAVRELLDAMANFSGNDQRARYLLSSNWMRDRMATAYRLGAEAFTDGLLPGIRDRDGGERSATASPE